MTLRTATVWDDAEKQPYGVRRCYEITIEIIVETIATMSNNFTLGTEQALDVAHRGKDANLLLLKEEDHQTVTEERAREQKGSINARARVEEVALCSCILLDVAGTGAEIAHTRVPPDGKLGGGGEGGGASARAKPSCSLGEVREDKKLMEDDA